MPPANIAEGGPVGLHKDGKRRVEEGAVRLAEVIRRLPRVQDNLAALGSVVTDLPVVDVEWVVVRKDVLASWEEAADAGDVLRVLVLKDKLHALDGATTPVES
jgi:hypothetical protein